MPELQILFSLLLGVGLSAACGFRVFVPCLVLSLAAQTGHVQLASGFAWMGTPWALAVFASATLLELLAYCFPFLDNALDALATPAAVVAGTVLTATQLGSMGPELQWILAAVAGGGSAATVQAPPPRPAWPRP